MKPVKSIVACCLLVFAAWAVNAQEELENLVKNPDFTDGQNGWGFYTGNSAGSWMVQPDGGVGDDGPCAFVEITATSGDGWYTPNLYTSGYVSLENNTEYTCTFWARTEEGEERDVTLTIQRGADPWNRFYKESFSINGEWNEYSMTWIHSETLVNAWVMIHTSGSDLRLDKGKLWVDHVRVYEGEYMEDDLSQGKIVKAVEPGGKLVSAWARIKVH